MTNGDYYSLIAPYLKIRKGTLLINPRNPQKKVQMQKGSRVNPKKSFYAFEQIYKDLFSCGVSLHSG